MITARLNLVCRKGHRHFAPERELPSWIGRECLKGAGMRANGSQSPGRCQELLRQGQRPKWWVVG